MLWCVFGKKIKQHPLLELRFYGISLFLIPMQFVRSLITLQIICTDCLLR